MSRYIDADKLIAEIERWRDKAKEKYNKNPYCMGRCDALAEFRNHIVSLQQEQPSLPSGLDDAAEKYSENILANNEDLQDAIEDAFKAGAEWMAGHGWHDVTEVPSIFGFYLVIHEKGWCVANYMGKGVVCKSGWVEAIHHIEIEHPQKWLDLRDLIPKNRPQ